MSGHYHRKSLTSSGDSTWDLLRLAAPIIAMMVSRMLMGFVDFVMVSKLGTEAQAAISPATMFIFMLACAGLGIATAVQTFVAQCDGRGERGQCGGYAWQSCYLAAAFAALTVPIALTTDVWFPWIARLGSHSAAVTALEIRYVKIALWSVAPSIVCIGLNGFFSGIQKPGIAFVASVISLAANIVGNWLLIFGNLGFPCLGIAGAAYSTIFAWGIRALVLILAMILPAFEQRYNTRHSLAFSWHKTRDLLRVGGPTAVTWLLDVGSWMVFLVIVIPSLGTAIMAASNIGLQLMHLSFMPAVGVGIALCSQVGFAIGEGRPERAMLRTRVALRVVGIYMAAIGLLFWLAREPLVGLLNSDPEIIAAGSRVLIWAAIFQISDAMCIVHLNALRGAGDTRWPAVAMGVCCWVIFAAGGWAMANFVPAWNLNGPWSMCTLYIVVLGVLLTLRWHAGRWRTIKLFADRPTPSTDD